MVKATRIVFLGSYPWSVLLLNGLWDVPGIEVTRIITTPGRGNTSLSQTPVEEFCRSRGAADRLVVSPSLDDAAFKRSLESFRAHFALSVAYPRRIPNDFCTAFIHGGLNLHPSLLPRWRGPDPVRRALLAADCKIGVTLHQIAEEFDAGDILWQEEVEVRSGDNSWSILERLGNITVAALPRILAGFVEGNLALRPQTGEATYASPVREEERWVRPEMTRTEADRLISALYPFKPALWIHGETVHCLAGPLSLQEEPEMVRLKLADGVFFARSVTVTTYGSENLKTGT
ncbi:MAG: hypothetical protein CVU57_00505 [Deltaproteobacteria bacterium HGW-Deltaproteobacteria-15]|jgi:methionyl-tRNA formyltransferase|nr:MAG: hypothetical protein CVU57_00505 [Deltaproteobacteria bacterium HGW-Deltaproteobacteria-15]